jgi:tetratricopeptide (TPR) repeat protein
LLGAAIFNAGCALVPNWDDIHSATATVKDTVTGKARRDRQTKTYAEARILERRREFAGAEQLYRDLLKEQPQSRDCHHRLAVMAAVQGKYEEANKLYQTALECSQPTADLLSDFGYCRYLQQQLPEAEALLRQALAIDPQHRAAMNNLALVLGELGKLDDAYRLFRQANDEAEAEANFAFICAQCGDLERALTHYSRALSVNPELRSATEALLQVTERMQMIRDHQAAATTPPEAATDPSGRVVPVTHDEILDRPQPRPLIEVFTASAARRPASTDASSSRAVDQVMAAQSSGPAQVPSPRPYAPPPSASTAPTATAAPGFPQPQAAGVTPGSTMPAPQPFNAPQMPQPQYLQPTLGPRTAQTTLSAPPTQAPVTNSGADAAAVLNAGGPFPPLVGGASARR